MNRDSQVSLKLLLKRDSFSFGEPINPQLHISNDTVHSLNLSREFIFDSERLGFAGANAVHLVGPDGADLTAPYRRDVSYFKENKSIQLLPGEDTWMFLPIHAHLQLWQDGRYTFWLNLADETGGEYESNRIKFRHEDVPATASRQAIELRLKSTTVSVSVVELEARKFTVDAEFRNNSPEALIVLRPQDDSLYGWVNPVYRFSVTDPAGRQLALSARCGTMAMPVYDKKSFIRIGPHGVHRQELRFPLVPEMLNPGEYRVRLTYLVRDRAIGKSGAILDRTMDWEPDVFVGCVESNEVNLKVGG